MRRRDFIAALSGSVVLSAHVAAAQPASVPVVGILHSGPGRGPDALLPQFVEALAEGGFVEGRNVAIEYRSSEGRDARLPVLAAELAERPVSVIVATGAFGATLAAKNATNVTPIVFMMAGDPVRYGVVDSLSRPGANVTGLSFDNVGLTGKRLELLCDLIPQAKLIGYLSGGPNFITYKEESESAAAAARSLGRTVVSVEAQSGPDLEIAFEILLRRGANGLLVGVAPPVARLSGGILRRAALHRLPAIYPSAPWAAAGGLMSYSPDLAGIYRQVATQYVCRILRGEKPADLPIQRSTATRLAVNLRTARLLGLDISPTFLARAEEVIE